MYTGSMATIVVNNGSLPPAFTRFPSVIMARLIRPPIAAVILEYSKSSLILLHLFRFGRDLSVIRGGIRFRLSRLPAG